VTLNYKKSGRGRAETLILTYTRSGREQSGNPDTQLHAVGKGAEQ
jgi:hypothetical protein